MIVVDRLRKTYGATTALAEVSFEVQAGEIVGLLGPHGAGKTTLLRILSGHTPASGGRALVAGHDVSTQPLAVRQRVGYLPAAVPLYAEMTVWDFLAFIAAAKGVPRRAAAVAEVLATCGLQEVARRRIGSLSLAQRRWVGLAQALLGPPAVLLLDAPTAGLDPAQRTAVYRLLAALTPRPTVLLSTTELAEACQLCQRIVILHAGRLRAIETPRRLRAYEQPYGLLALEIEGPQALVVYRLRQIDGVIDVEPGESGTAGVRRYTVLTDRDLRAALAQAVVQCGWHLRELRPLSSTLADVLPQLMADHA
ncbi:MAG: ABC transporter ATP-binding protein [Candidatus Tectimicrobiota bacterium]|nr:MAG: ABC transporter ATP-binding protein [Candidatus Tectomicrobia bacterium]